MVRRFSRVAWVAKFSLLEGEVMLFEMVENKEKGSLVEDDMV